MKKILLIITLIFSLLSCSQEQLEKSTIKNDFEKYLLAVKNKKIDDAVNCIYPKFFDIVPKEQMKQMLEITYNNPQLGFIFKKYNIDDIKKIEHIKKEFYTTVNYTFDVELQLNSEELKSKQSLIKDKLESKFGSDNIKFSNENQTFQIHSTKKAIGISKDGKTNWKFVVMENEYKPYLIKILPEKIINEN